MTTEIQRPTLRQWGCLLGLTAAATVYNTSEFLPTALLTSIGESLGVSESGVGMVISTYAWVVTLLSLPLMILASRVSMRRLLLWVLGLFALLQLATGLSQGYWVLMVSRMGVACVHALFWAIVAPLAVRQMPEAWHGVALGTLSVGSSVAMVLGIPLGRALGLHVGWRGAFLTLGALAAILFLALLPALPPTPKEKAFTFGEVPGLLKNRTLLKIYGATMLALGGYYCWNSYLDAFLLKTAGLTPNTITGIFTVLGLASVGGGVLYTLVSRRCNRLLELGILTIGIPLLILLPVAHSLALTVLFCALPAIGFTLFNVSCQSDVVSSTQGSASAVAMAIFSALFNLGVAAGTLLGAGVCDIASLGWTAPVGGVVALLALSATLLGQSKKA